MDVRTLSESYSVSPQIVPEDLTKLAGAGFRSVMCNRPDAEEPGQPAFAEIAAAAKAAGIEARWIPVVGGPTQDALEAFEVALEEMPKPMLAYCRSGTRSAMMWTIVQHEHARLSDAEILGATSAAGYDMAGLVQQLQQMRR